MAYEANLLMTTIVAPAHAADPAPAGPPGGGLMGFLPLIIIFVIFYFLLIRPQSKRAKEHRAMIAALNKGDEIVTNGGVLGRITDVGDSFVTVEIADGVAVKVQRQAVAALMPKGTVKGE
jgi:preprotein translocase subunit YajC